LRHYNFFENPQISNEICQKLKFIKYQIFKTNDHSNFQKNLSASIKNIRKTKHKKNNFKRKKHENKKIELNRYSLFSLKSFGKVYSRKENPKPLTKNNICLPSLTIQKDNKQIQIEKYKSIKLDGIILNKRKLHFRKHDSIKSSNISSTEAFKNISSYSFYKKYENEQPAVRTINKRNKKKTIFQNFLAIKHSKVTKKRFKNSKILKAFNDFKRKKIKFSYLSKIHKFNSSKQNFLNKKPSNLKRKKFNRLHNYKDKLLKQLNITLQQK
jgi:hypothetical protein